MVASSELRVRACRRDGVRGEHSAWWMKCAWSPALEVATMYCRGDFSALSLCEGDDVSLHNFMTILNLCQVNLGKELQQ